MSVRPKYRSVDNLAAIVGYCGMLSLAKYFGLGNIGGTEHVSGLDCTEFLFPIN